MKIIVMDSANVRIDYNKKMITPSSKYNFLIFNRTLYYHLG